MLDRAVAERIAAGEVVDRPGSVVKELVENSLDAGARHIKIELTAGGLERIRISDDGHGMSAADCELAIQRFATSKISQWEDLDSLTTLGFRGEALPSVAAVSKLEIVTCEMDSSQGSVIVVEGSEVKHRGPASAAKGTRITIDDLFYNTPARKKFLKSPVAETTYIVDLVARLALTQPTVQFEVLSNNKELLMVSHRLSTRERLATLWKIPTQAFVAFSHEVNGIQAEGYVALPHYAKSNRSYQLFSLNGRLIKSQALSQAVLEGFGPMMVRGKYPVAFVQLTLDPAQVDVNVHPSKAEVRFADNKSPFRAIYRGIAHALETEQADTVDPDDWAKAVREPSTLASLDEMAQQSPPQREEPKRYEAPRPNFSWSGTLAQQRGSQELVQATLDLYGQVDAVRKFPESPTSAPLPEPTPASLTPVTARPLRPEVEVLAQLDLTFIIAKVGRELWVVDQHTAHERIWYERLAPRITEDQAFRHSQGLLIPEVIEWSPALSEFVAANLEIFAELGFELEPFGGHAFQLRSVPHGLKAKEAPKVIHQVVDEFCQDLPAQRSLTREAIREKCRAMVSCKSAIKSGDPLSNLEMKVLIEQMLDVEHSLYCPHGRPTRIKLTRDGLDRLFHRT